jgi:hypothetical protein
VITATMFLSATGIMPEGDDLERCNCTMGGKTGHYFCGWDDEGDMPVFMATPHKLAAEVNRCSTIVMREIEFEGRPRNFYEPPFRTMVTSGQFWRCFHGVTRFDVGECPECKKEWDAK